jgi:hypothetical protein
MMSRGCFTSYKIVWDPGEFITYGQVQEFLIGRDFTDLASRHMGVSPPWRHSTLVVQLAISDDCIEL